MVKSLANRDRGVHPASVAAIVQGGTKCYRKGSRREVFMKVNFDIECTPEEARRFLGLPDLGPMQERMMKEIEERMAENLRALDPETLVKTWMPMSMQGWGEMQKMFWSQMGVNMPADPKAKKK